MLSDEDATPVKIAIDVCNRPEIKMEILCTPGSEYDAIKGTFPYENKARWTKTVEKKAKAVLDNFDIENKTREMVMGNVMLVGLRMLTWAEYHEGTLGISRECSFNLINVSSFTKQGIIDSGKAAEELMKDRGLTAKQKYMLACIYCFVDRIPGLYKQMTADEKKEFYDSENIDRINQPELVKFWSYYHMSEIDLLKGEKTPLDQYRLEIAVESGSKAAVQYCLEKTKLIFNKYALIEAGVDAVKCINETEPRPKTNWVIFENPRSDDRDVSWIPKDYYADILRFILSKMGEVLRREFLKQDIVGSKYEKVTIKDQNYSRVLECLLDWPHQDYFMKAAKLMWDFLPEKDFATLLLRMCDKMKPRKESCLSYGEDQSYDYKEMLKEFWHQSDEHYKRYVLSNSEIEFVNERGLTRTKTCVGLLIQLLTLSKYTFKDRNNISLILASATNKEKKNLIDSQEWRKMCMTKMVQEKWEVLDRLVLNSSLSAGGKYKKEFCFSPEARRICLHFIKNSKWTSAETFIIWTSLSEEDVKILKKEILFSDDGRNASVDLITDHKNIEALDTFIRWCVSSEEEAREFRKVLIFSNEGTGVCAYLVESYLLELANDFINYCISTECEKVRLRRMVAFKYGGPVCEDLISENKAKGILDNDGFAVGLIVVFMGGQWEKVEQFLTWCYSSEEEISGFKKNVLLKKYGTIIHFNLVKSNRFDEAETFFAWLGLSAEEIKNLKKNTIFRCGPAREMLFSLIYREETFLDFGSREDAIELLLRWYLTDRESVLEYKVEFRRLFQESKERDDEYALEYFNTLIEKRLRDLDEERAGNKRKSDTFSPNKKLCTSSESDNPTT